MRTDSVTAALMAAWVVAVGAFGDMAGTTSFAGWPLLPVVSLVPPALMVRLWSVPPPDAGAYALQSSLDSVVAASGARAAAARAGGRS
jgi:hypothetical protein